MPKRLWALALLLTLASVGARPASVARADDTLVLLVRHAETEPDGTTDAPLSEAGRQRADRLVATLADVPLTAVHTTPYRRTRGTATPVAAARGLTVMEYDANQLEAFARTLASAGGFHLVVGHSNTTPALVRALGGDAGTPIAENEHDRLYVLRIEGGDVETLLLRLPGERISASR